MLWTNHYCLEFSHKVIKLVLSSKGLHWVTSSNGFFPNNRKSGRILGCQIGFNNSLPTYLTITQIAWLNAIAKLHNDIVYRGRLQNPTAGWPAVPSGSGRLSLFRTIETGRNRRSTGGWVLKPSLGNKHYTHGYNRSSKSCV